MELGEEISDHGISKKRKISSIETVKIKKEPSGVKSKTSTLANEDDVVLVAGKGGKDTGAGPGGHHWSIFFQEKRAGKVFINLIDDETLGKHPSIQIFLNKSSQGNHIGRHAYKKACELSQYDKVFAYMSKKNVSSVKSASAAGFKEIMADKTRQTIMEWVRKKKDLGSLMANTYSDFTGTYCVDSIFGWVNTNCSKWVDLKVKEFLPYVQLDTWGESSDSITSNLQHFMEDDSTKERVLRADLSYPIVVTNDNKIIDGIHRVFKAIYEGRETISSIFINQSVLNTFKINVIESFPQTGLELPIPDRYLRVSKSSLPLDQEARRDILESYFSDHLPSVSEEENSWLICLERPQEQYGCYIHDQAIHSGLEWWQKKTKICDIPFQKRLFDYGLLAIEDQWMPYSWSRFCQKNGIPSEAVLLHLDDHQDMMMPRVGKRLDGKLFDYITGDSFSLDDPSSVESAILSGAIGKGSILLPFIWSVEKMHIRHLCFRPHPNTYYHVQKILREDPLLSKDNNRISIHLDPTSLETLSSSSNYVVTPDIDEWLKDIPSGVPIFLHIDMDYFNDRFDGKSDWRKENKRIHEVSLQEQIEQMKRVFTGLKEKGLVDQIVDTSIGISPGFYPAEFWPSTVPELIKACERIGIKLNK